MGVAVAPPSLYGGVANGLAVLVLLTEFLMLRASLQRAQVRLYMLQSSLVAILAGVVAGFQDVPELYALAGLSVILKVIAVPAVTFRLLRRTQSEIAGSGALGVASEGLLAVVVAAFGVFVTARFGFVSPVLPPVALAIAVAVVLVSFVLMIVRRDVLSQAVGFFSLENGVSLASLVVAAGLPLILEVAFLFDLLVAVLVFGLLIRVHHDRRESLSTADLTELRG